MYPDQSSLFDAALGMSAIGVFFAIGASIFIVLGLVRLIFFSDDSASEIRFMGAPVGGLFAGAFRFTRALAVLPAIVIAALASPFAWLFQRIGFTRAISNRMARGYAWAFERVTGLFPSPVMKGDLEEVWRVREIGPDDRPELHNADIPADIRRPLWRDGYTVLDESLVTLADARIDLDAPLRLGRVAALTSLSVFALIMLIGPMFTGGGAAPPFAVYDAVLGSSVGGDYWPGAAPETAGVMTAVLAAVTAIPAWLTSGIGAKAIIAFGVAFVSGLLVSASGWWQYYQDLREPYALDTRDLHRSARRYEDLRTAETTYRESVNLATGYERGQPVLQLGEATGHARMRGDPSAPQPGQAMTIDRSALYQHLAVIGGTGEGKTTAIFSPLFKWALRIPGQSALVMDDKAAIWKDIKAFAEKVGRGHDVRVIGTEPDMANVDLLAGLEPQAVVQILGDMSAQVSKGATDGFFEEMAMTVIRHTLVVASAVERTDEGRAWCEKTGRRVYSLGWVYSVLTSRQQLALEIVKLLQVYERGGEDARRIRSEQLETAINWLKENWLSEDVPKNTVGSIEMTVQSFLDKLCTEPALKRFAWAEGTNCMPIEEVFQGRVVCLALSQLEYGSGAKVAAMLIKSNFYRAARLREMRLGSKKCQKRSVILLIDEAQALLTAGSNLSDKAFSNVARSTGVQMVIATQSVPALNVCFGGTSGHNVTKDLLANFRSKVFLRVEDPETMQYVSDLAGDQLRATTGLGDESVDARITRARFRPLSRTTADDLMIDEGRAWLAPFAQLERSSYLLSQEFTAGVGGMEGSQLVDHVPQVIGLDPGTADPFRNETVRMRQQALAMEENRDDDGKLQLERVVRTSDIEGMGRYHGVFMLQRAGAQRLDLARIKHDFG